MAWVPSGVVLMHPSIVLGYFYVIVVVGNAMVTLCDLLCLVSPLGVFWMSWVLVLVSVS